MHNGPHAHVVHQHHTARIRQKQAHRHRQFDAPEAGELKDIGYCDETPAELIPPSPAGIGTSRRTW